MSAPSVWAVLPVKPFALAKRRLATVFNGEERATLARSMFEDVLATLVTARGMLAGVIVVTADDGAVAIAELHDVQILREPSPAGLNQALALAARYLAGMSPTAMLVVPADIPHLTIAAIEQSVRALDGPSAVMLVPAVKDHGTNLLGCRPADVIALGFGPESFQRHCQAALAVGIDPTVLDFRDLGLDIDRPDDLNDFLSLETRTRTHAYLSNVDIARRLKAPAAVEPQSIGCW